MIVEVIINRSAKKLNRTFDYSVPKELENMIFVGTKVLVSFGNSKKLEEAYVIGIKNESNYKVKDIEKIQDNILSNEKIELANWIAKRYFSNVSDAIKLLLPPGTGNRDVNKRVKIKTENFIKLCISEDEVKDKIRDNFFKSEKQKRILQFLCENPDMAVTDLIKLTDTSRAVVNTLKKNGYVQIYEKQVYRNPLQSKFIERDTAIQLNDEQKYANDRIIESIDNEMFNEFLLYGVTGSGKTEVYMHLIEYVIKLNKTAIMLVPEISLTPQMVDRFIARFGEDIIAVLHSKLSVGERYDEWNRIKEGKAKIIIGARSAIFAPVSDLGIIIIDEEHDMSYKSDMSPRYDAKEISEYLAEKNNIPLVLGSATPDIVTYYRAMHSDIIMLELTKRANSSNLPDVKVVDLRYELAKGNRTMISEELYNLIDENLKNKRQTILFLNRRGYSTFVMCRDCGYTVKCKNCNITMTYHIKQNKMKCHYCGYETALVKKCPECQSENIRYFGTGTQKLEMQINKMFPNASILRMDIDTVTKKNSHEDILNKFKNENIDILVGTQMIVKGHHFPNVTLVGVIAADTSLNIDDYRASERTFQTITQVAGRAGREKLPGKVIVQTYNPDNFSIDYASKQDYKLFYNAEILLRKQLKYPPFCDIIVIGITSVNEKLIIDASNYIYNILVKVNKRDDLNLLVCKPMPAPIDKIKNKYRWRIICKAEFNDKINNVLNSLLKDVQGKKVSNKEELRINIDVNPNNML